MEAAGFQTALRFSGGDHDGTQAGRLEPYDTRVVVRTDHSTGVEYAQHTGPGSMVEPGALAVWSWTLLLSSGGREAKQSPKLRRSR